MFSRILQEYYINFKMNHSLRVTSATRLFQSDIDELLIMNNTGHRSIDGVRCYKRVGEDWKKAITSILNSAANGQLSVSDENKATS
jgi:integrase